MDRSAAQLGLFGSLEGFPEGFSYEENILSLEEERTLIRAFAGLPLKAFEFQGFQGKRRVVSFGLHYDFNTRGLGSAETIPEFVIAVREKVAGFAEVSAEALQHVLVTEYAQVLASADIATARSSASCTIKLGSISRPACPQLDSKAIVEAFTPTQGPLGAVASDTE